MLNKTRELVLKHEINGISISLFLKSLFMLIAVLLQVLTQKSIREGFFIGAFTIPAIILAIASLVLIRKKRFIRTIGYLSLMMDLTIIWLLPFVWYQSVGGELISRTYLLKTDIPSFIFAFLLLNALTLNPRLPLIFSLGAAPLFIVLLLYAQQDPRVVLTRDYVDGIIGQSVHETLYSSKFFQTLIFGIILFLITRTARNMIYKSSEYEVKNSQLSRYFSPAVVQKISGEEELFFRPGGKEQIIAVFFSDIRDFTTLSENQSPEETIQLLSEYHNLMVSVIFEYGGTVDKFIGDGILATFGTPIPLKNPCLNAVQAALKIRERMQELNQTRKEHGAQAIRHGIGIHYGPAIVGNIGISDRLEYTVIGDTVNTASRIESHCKKSGHDILISEEVFKTFNNMIEADFVSEEVLKGKTIPVKLYTIN